MSIKRFISSGTSKPRVAGFKLDRAEEDIPETGPHKVFDGRTIRENRNAYPAMYVKAVYEAVRREDCARRLSRFSVRR